MINVTVKSPPKTKSSQPKFPCLMIGTEGR